MGWQDYRSQHEPILYGWKEGQGKHSFYGDRKNTSIWNVKRDSVVGYKHPTQKPVLLLEDLIKTFSNENDLIVDLTMGSGSTGVAAKNTNRNFIGIEQDENYFNIAEKRIKETKQQTKLF